MRTKISTQYFSLLFIQGAMDPKTNVGGRAWSKPAATISAPSTNDKANTTLVEAVLSMEITHVRIREFFYFGAPQTGEVPFTYQLDQTEINAGGAGKVIYSFTRPAIDGAPACNMYFEAKLELILKATLSLTNDLADYICRLKGTLWQTPVEPSTSADCPNSGPIDKSALIKAQTISQPIDIPIYQGSSNSNSITSSPLQASLAADDSCEEFAAGEDVQTKFFIKNLKTHPVVCKVPTPTPVP